jgi:hypothetical protein
MDLGSTVSFRGADGGTYTADVVGTLQLIDYAAWLNQRLGKKPTAIVDFDTLAGSWSDPRCIVKLVQIAVADHHPELNNEREVARVLGPLANALAVVEQIVPMGDADDGADPQQEAEEASPSTS